MITDELIGMAESIKAQELYDLAVSFDPFQFFKLRHQKWQTDNQLLCSIIFKLN